METQPHPHETHLTNSVELASLPLFAPKAEFLSKLRTVQAVASAQPELTMEVTVVRTEKADASVLQNHDLDGKKAVHTSPVFVTTLQVNTVEKDSRTTETVRTPLQENSPLDILVQKIEDASSLQEKKLHKTAEHMVEMVQSAGSLLAGTMRIFSMAAAACPHCISATTQLFSRGLSSGFGFGGIRGHYHKDGTFHADDDSHQEPDAASGFWLDWMKAA